MHSLKEGDIRYLAGNWPLRQDRPVVVFIHGAALSKELWAAQVEAFSDIADTIALDLPGHKDSGGEARDRIADYAEAVGRLVDALGIACPVLCGMSMGGAIALELLIARPDRFRSAILMNTGARLKVMPLVFETIQKDYAAYQDMVVALSISPKSDGPRLKALMNDIAVGSPDVAFKDFTACDRFDAMDRLDRITGDVLVVIGEDDAVTPPKYGRYLAQGIPNAKLATVAACGHLSPLEQSEQITGLIRGFLAETGLQRP